MAPPRTAAGIRRCPLLIAPEDGRRAPTFPVQGASHEANEDAGRKGQVAIESNGEARRHESDAGEGPRVPPGVAADVREAAFGDAAAFERLYRAHVGRVYAVVCRLAGSERADELTQDVFVRAWEKLETFRGEAAFGSWLHRLAVNVVYSRLRAVGARREREVGNELPLARARAPRDSIEIRLDFEVAIERLPRGARKVFVLHDIEGYKHREIAEMLEITTGTSKSQLHRARMIMRRHLDA
ncbi:RNA polymerase sigma factor [Candidatus Palauibacter sp.]|uniref:RNA polymerase sigma factor n=1 Tax=Candidatus Palauibacter sp. TaxID=3101350 RepID=UPI003AF26CC8